MCFMFRGRAFGAFDPPTMVEVDSGHLEDHLFINTRLSTSVLVGCRGRGADLFPGHGAAEASLQSPKNVLPSSETDKTQTKH